MKIFVDIPALANNKFKVSAIKAIRSLSYPVMSIMDAKKLTETPGWHRIPNNVVAPLGKTKHDLINFVESYALDYSALSDAIHDYGAIIVFHNHNTEPAGYKPPAPTPEPLPPTPTPKPLPPTPNDLLDSLTPALTKALEIRDYTMLRIIAGVAEDIIEKYNL